jgi:hypothetical protein
MQSGGRAQWNILLIAMAWCFLTFNCWCRNRKYSLSMALELISVEALFFVAVLRGEVECYAVLSGVWLSTDFVDNFVCNDV